MNQLTDEQEKFLKDKSCEIRCEKELELETCEEAFDKGFVIANNEVFEKIESLFKDGYINQNSYHTLISELFPKK